MGVIVSLIWFIFSALHWINWGGKMQTEYVVFLTWVVVGGSHQSDDVRSIYESDLLRCMPTPRMEPAAVLAAAASSAP